MDKEFLSQIDRIDELISRSEKLEDDILICECHCVNVSDIKSVCANEQVFDLEKVQEKYKLGRGCQECLKRIDSWVNNIF